MTTIPTRGQIRLQKFLSGAGVCSRRRAEVYIAEGRVAVNGQVVTELGTKVDPESDDVMFDGHRVTLAESHVYIALNKPPGYVTSCLQKQETTVMELVAVDQRVFPVGRLDKPSCGLLLMTSDGGLHQRLSHPSFDHEKEYDVACDRPVSDADLDAMRRGMVITGRKTRPAKVKRLSDRRFLIILQEGRNRQIRRMAEMLGNRVVLLRRIRIAHIHLGDLAEGRWRYLTEEEKKALLHQEET
ncbi:pseudouridine synthase [Desulfosudis oleivorans]|uniref:Pseudouridine synthase n=1 Tax=Desulfosudis oleivorans (strain DSM 6200 / JCM 39069 / Hxd3) TaxID=96561 RepID=A8ZRV1_DESOH|nr:pseudouridine synthase [Desulfosudis oleivorans]ABW65868.1 pseudouridine synthase [Desulfosudis oleivorans Hxd3]